MLVSLHVFFTQLKPVELSINIDNAVTKLVNNYKEERNWNEKRGLIIKYLPPPSSFLANFSRQKGPLPVGFSQWDCSDFRSFLPQFNVETTDSQLRTRCWYWVLLGRTLSFFNSLATVAMQLGRARPSIFQKIAKKLRYFRLTPDLAHRK